MGGYVLDQSRSINRYFEEISKIPRETEHEEKISDYVVEFAKDHGMRWTRDDYLNVIIWKEASAGYEDAEPVILQSHMDMVCSKTPDSSHDFRKDPIELILDGNTLRAKDTSLGADDGYGMAYILSVLDDDSLAHPPLECVFTTQEEHKTMVGAEHLDVSELKGRRLINIDGDVEEAIFVSSASSDLIKVSKTFSREKATGEGYELTVKNLTGDVIRGVTDQDCGNAIKILFRILKGLEVSGYDVRLASADGGVGENRSPRDAKAVFTCRGGRENVENEIKKEFGKCMCQYESTEFSGDFDLEEKPVDLVIGAAESMSVINFFYLLPNNLFQADVRDGSFDSMSTFGIVETQRENIKGIISARSLHQESEHQLVQHIITLAETCGFRVDVSARYRSWPYRERSPLRDLFKALYMEKTGRPLEECICPGGLEISWFAHKIEGLDAYSLGQHHENCHTINEFMDMDSFYRVYDLLVEALASMK